MKVGESVGLGLSDGTSVGLFVGDLECEPLGLSDGNDVSVTGEPVGLWVVGLRVGLEDGSVDTDGMFDGDREGKLVVVGSEVVNIVVISN